MMGYVAWLEQIKAPAKFTELVAKPLIRMNKPYLMLAIAFVISALVKFAIPAPSSVLALLLATIYPVLISTGISPLSAATAISCGSAMPWGPSNSFLFVGFTSMGLDVKDVAAWSIQTELKYMAILIVFMSVAGSFLGGPGMTLIAGSMFAAVIGYVGGLDAIVGIANAANLPPTLLVFIFVLIEIVMVALTGQTMPMLTVFGPLFLILSSAINISPQIMVVMLLVAMKAFNTIPNSVPEDKRTVYKERADRVAAAFRMERPDRVPFTVSIYGFYARAYGISSYEASQDLRTVIPGVKQFIQDVDPDMSPGMFTYNHDLVMTLGASYIRLPGPGYGLSLNTPFQFIDDTYLQDDEFGEFLTDPTNYILTKLLTGDCFHSGPNTMMGLINNGTSSCEVLVILRPIN